MIDSSQDYLNNFIDNRVTNQNLQDNQQFQQGLLIPDLQNQNIFQEPDIIKKFELSTKDPWNTQTYFPNIDPLEMQHHRVSIAPMMEITTTYFRYFMRLLTRHSVLYTEMVHENTILNYKQGHLQLLRFFPIEHPVVLQLGGNDPIKLRKCAIMAQEMNYDEINLNVGCPSAKVQEGAFGACLMKDAQLVSQCMSEVKKVVQIPVTVKCRLGVDDFDSYEFVKQFVGEVAKNGGIQHFVIHARKAFLKGLNPTENRNIPPLKYEWVVQLKKDFPHLQFTINGGFKNLEQVSTILQPENNLAGVMIGRAAYENPWILSDVDRLFYNQPNVGYSRREILEKWGEFGDYVINVENKLMTIPSLVKPIIHLFANEKHGSKYKRYLSSPDNFKKADSFYAFIMKAVNMLDKFNKDILDQKPPINDI